MIILTCQLGTLCMCYASTVCASSARKEWELEWCLACMISGLQCFVNHLQIVRPSSGHFLFRLYPLCLCPLPRKLAFARLFHGTSCRDGQDGHLA